MVAELHAAQSDVLTRDQLAPEDIWDLSTIYAADAAWETDAAALPAAVAKAAAHRGLLGASADALRVALDDAMAVRRLADRLGTYASLRADEDTSDQANNARRERATALAIEAGQALAFMEPEILAIPPQTLETYRADPALATYGHLLDDLIRQRPHVRSVEIEELLAQAAEIARIPRDAFGQLDNADLEFGTVVDDTGAQVTLTKGRHALLLESKNREVRRGAHETLIRAYQNHGHTLAALHAGSVRKDVFQARVRNHESARAAALFENNIPVSVYDGLIAAVRTARPSLERFLALRKRALKLDELAVYDLRVPLAPTPAKRFGYREAVEIVLSGLGPLGARYVSDLRAGFANRWVDVHETKGKRSGAYSSGTYGAPPVILMNWNGTLNDVFTLAHEAGHAMHSHYAMANNPYHDAYYTIFLAEIASTVNEVLLTWHLLDQTPADDLVGRFALLDRFADGFNGTVITQTMFAEFERETHAGVEAGEPLTLTGLNDLYGGLQADYTPGVVVDDTVRIRWARIPHFYRGFYVFQYATGMSAAVAIARALRDEGARAAERYLAMLAAGGSDYSLSILQGAGVDLTTPAPIEAALAEFDRVVTEMEALADRGVLDAAA
ncbi:MAG: Oligoendopeptidase F [uncultured Thermomicrobiales bacterium]|uniref:Oligopeptidase F n=1 Tax=uncultured Thermomicrobiales bacterium TaxID=1645740 RepID=A0A6J4UP80_9BACT|nr:MAG: Oligoendopeptidase F [uncultured Thermomicrobiales bacterium]